MIRVGIIGGAGYTAGELIRLLLNHPEVRFAFVHSESNAGRHLHEVHEGIYGDTDLKFCDSFDLADADVLFLCQKMQRLDLYGTVDTVFCALDSINHLSGPEQVLETFKRVAFFLNDDGWFIFDVNTPFKHEKVLADNTFVYDLPDIYCVWQNTYNPQDGSVAIELDFFERQGKLYARSSERFSERAYSAEKLTALLREAGFDRVEVFGDMRFDAPAPDEQRMIFAAHITNSQNGVFAG